MWKPKKCQTFSLVDLKNPDISLWLKWFFLLAQQINGASLEPILQAKCEFFVGENRNQTKNVSNAWMKYTIRKPALEILWWKEGYRVLFTHNNVEYYEWVSLVCCDTSVGLSVYEHVQYSLVVCHTELSYFRCLSHTKRRDVSPVVYVAYDTSKCYLQQKKYHVNRYQISS